MFGRKDKTINTRNPRKLRITDEKEAMDGELVEEVWSKKRVGIALLVIGFVLLFVIVGVRYFLPDGGVDSVLSAQTKMDTSVKIPTQDDVKSVIQNAQESLQKITEENVTSSQAAIQKVIQDLQSIQSGSNSSQNIFCQLVCR